MDSSSKIIIPEKTSAADSNRLKLKEIVNYSENLNPNVSTPGLKFSKSASIVKSGKSAKKYASINLNPNQVAMPPLKNNIRGRKFVIAKKKSRKEELNSSSSVVVCDKCKKAIGQSKCVCLAYESLRASHEEFFRNCGDSEIDDYDEKIKECENVAEIVKGKIGGNDEITDDVNEAEMNLKRSRDRLLEEARECVPETGFGRVMHLVKAFEKLTLLRLGDSVKKEMVEDDKKGIKWALPGLQLPPKILETQVSSSSFCPSDFYLTSDSLGLDAHCYCSLESSQGSFNFSTRTSAGGQKSRRSSTESSGTFARRQLRRKQQKVTSQKPFMLRTEQRGKCKEEEFMKKLQQMKEEEEKLRVTTAQFVPLTTEEPECLVRPPVKENTRPVDLVLHSDTRAVERAEFDHQVAEKLSRIERCQMERERQQKLEEKEEIRRLRKELVPKAQPMPYFDRPFIPRRSMKHPTIPKEPKFHLPQRKKIKCYASLDDLYEHRQ